MKFDMNSAMKTAKAAVTANSPILLVGAAITGVVATGILSAKAGYKARGLVDQAVVVKGAPLTTREHVDLTWLCYAAPALTGVSTIASVAGVHAVHSKRNAALAGLYAMATSRLDDYKDEAEKLLGTKRSQQANEASMQKAADRTPFVNNQVMMTGDGRVLCYDEWTGRYFHGSMNAIEASINVANAKLNSDGDLTLNDFYDDLGLPGNVMGDNFGWTAEVIAARFGEVTAPDGTPAIAFSFQPEPKPNLGRSK